LPLLGRVFRRALADFLGRFFARFLRGLLGKVFPGRLALRLLGFDLGLLIRGVAGLGVVLTRTGRRWVDLSDVPAAGGRRRRLAVALGPEDDGPDARRQDVD